MINIKHAPLLDTDLVISHYEEKDGVPIKYVCTSALGGQEFAVDIFYRSSPHPEFGNHYFGLYLNQYADNAQIMITNADVVEELEFHMIQDNEGVYWYSSHRHDCLFIDGGMIDGGRAYVRTNGCETTPFKVRGGEFYIAPNTKITPMSEEEKKASLIRELKNWGKDSVF
jgi:hypothetical protein